MSLDTQNDVEIRPCRECRSPVFDDELFCEACGTGLVETAAEVLATQRTDDREEIDLGSAAAITDRGLRRRRNEDAMAIAVAGNRGAAAVCDGVASTANPDLAARAAATEALACLEPLLRVPEPLRVQDVAARLREAFARARQAVMGVPDDEPDGNDLSPSTTLVAAVATPEHVVIGNVGDSRAYWCTPDACRLLTTDDSWAQEAIAEGMTAERAYAHPDAHTITRWIGSDAEWAEPAITELPITERGVLVLCSDGLWNYFGEPGTLGRLVYDPGLSDPGQIARRLTDAALTSGGQDNITVVVVPIDPPATVGNGATEESLHG
jgi:serine/threonine protein phosphatase PrpC